MTIGDEISVDVSFFDIVGNLLDSTRQVDLPSLQSSEARFGEAFFKVPLDFSPLQYRILHDSRLIPLNQYVAFAPYAPIAGRHAGDSILAVVVGEFPGYTQPIQLSRLRGPFNMSVTMSNNLLKSLSSGADGGQDAAFLIDGALPARLLSANALESRIRFELRDGDVLPIRETTLSATVMLTDLDQFSLYLNGRPGEFFSLSQGCKLGTQLLPRGSYFVSSVNGDTIHLLGSPTHLPQLIGRPLWATLHLQAPIGRSSTGGES